jgi:hypothetical protein
LAVLGFEFKASGLQGVRSPTVGNKLLPKEGEEKDTEETKVTKSKMMRKIKDKLFYVSSTDDV